MIKSAYGHNHHGRRNTIINRELCQDECPRCGRCEDWEYVILCKGIEEFKVEYLNKMKQKMSKEAKTDDKKDAVELILNDIKRYLFQENNEYATTQNIVGMRLIVRGWVVKNWRDID